MSKLSRDSRVLNAAIAQSVERILGKDEVASSNLASSSKASEIFGFQRFSFYPPQELVTSSAELPMAILIFKKRS